MAELLKNKLTASSLREFAAAIKSAYEPFPIDDFVRSVMDERWGGLELKARGRQVTLGMAKYLPSAYEQALGVLDKIAHECRGMERLSFSDFVEVFGQDERHWDLSMGALARYTIGSTSEFAVRPFIIKHEKRAMAQLYAWATHENEEVRRLASEGCRPALAWEQALVSFKKEPAPILPILEKLKADPSLYVRKSVANNLNDISKTHPDLVARLAREWYGKHEHTDWVVKRGCRTLLKKGEREALAIFGYDNADAVQACDFAIQTESVPLGGALSFSFNIRAKEATKARLEYGIDYVRANGKRNRKIFQISEIPLQANASRAYVKKHSFAEVSARKHYLGTHAVTLIVNGAERGTLEFEVLI